MKWLINILLFFLLYKLGKSLWGAPQKVEEKVTRDDVSEELVEDPQCNTYIPLSTALKGPGGKYFCSKECLESYKSGQKAKEE